MMFDEVSVFNFSGIYDEESFYRNDKGSSFCNAVVKKFDLREMSGTNCMCDDAAVDSIRRLLSDEKVAAGGVHFIDSGNYHYMSALLTQLLKEPFSLVVLDHHPDMQPPMFGDILSCGGWVLKVLEENEFVRDVHIIGADEKLVALLDPEDASKVKFYDFENGGDEPGSGAVSFDVESFKTDYPVYLSIDKDVLSRKEVVTNWDQGDMDCRQLFLLVKKLMAQGKLLGVDVCGECAPDQEDCDVAAAISGNDAFNRQILELLLEED
ncbi:MAG: arginase family protein [Butyrivibrio sp.]|nr:arginase family protein [Butyrivibrio sp.]